MSVVLGLFVGGSGKYVAELLKGWSAFYDWTFDHFLVLDVDPEELLAGSFALGTDLVLPDAEFKDRLQETIVEWSKDKFAQGIVRWDNRYEASVMHSTAKALSRVSQAAGGGMWTLRAMGLPGIDTFLRSARGLQFIGQLREMLNQARQEHPDEAILLYIIFSTAGGTGAGLSIPLALMVRELSRDVRPAVVPIAVLSSSFHNDWGDENNSGNLNTRTRGESGTFAVYRELEFLSRKLDMQAIPARRVIPVGNTVRYFDTGVVRPEGDPRPNFTLAEHVFWFGRRPVDAAARASDCFQELARVYAVLSDPEIARQIGGHNAFQRSHLRLIPSCVSVEYRRLEAAERLGSTLLVQTIDGWLLKEANFLFRPPSFFEWAPPSPAPIITFIHSQRDSLFARRGDAETGGVPSEQFVDFLRSLVPDNTLKGMELIREDDRGGYDANDDDWRELANRLLRNFDTQLNELTNSAQQQIDQAVGREYGATQLWLRERVIEQQLNSREGGLGTARRALESIRGEFRGIAQLFNRVWPEVIVGSAQRDPLPSQEGAMGALETAKAGFLSNQQRGSTPQDLWHHWLFAAFLVLCTGILSGWLAIDKLDFGTHGGMIAGLVVAGLAWFGVRRLQKPREGTKPELRREAVAKLQDTYESLLLATRADYAWKTIRERFTDALIGLDEDADKDSETVRIKQSLKNLEELINDIRGSEQGRLLALARRPPCIIAEIGTTPEIPPVRIPDLRNQMRESIRLLVAKSESQPRITIELTHEEQPKRFRLDDLLNRQDKPEKIQRYEELLRHMEAIARVATTGANILPVSFTDIVKDSDEMANQLSDLGRRANTRGPSCDVEKGLAAPAISLLVVGSEKLQALVGQAVNDHLAASDQPEHRRILQALREIGDRRSAQVSKRVGESVFLFDIWEFGEDQKLEDLKRAQTCYYSTGHQVDQRTLPERYSAGNFEFHIIPELSTATYIEFERSLWKPLSLSILQRLRGCDLRLPGPTVLDLFYIARVEGLIEEVGMQSNNQNGQVWLKTSKCGNPDCGDVLLLNTNMYDPDPQDPFGSGRLMINQFDAFADLMAYESSIADAAVATTLTGVGATIMSARWAPLGPLRLRAIKECLASRFYTVRRDQTKIQKLYDDCFKLAEKDTGRMPERIGNEWLAICRTVFDHASLKLKT